MDSEITSFLDVCSLTREFDAGEKAAFAKCLRAENFTAKKVIFEEGSSNQRMYLVMFGNVLVSKKITADMEEVVARFGRGNFFGELSLIDNKSPRSATVQTESDATLLILEMDKLFELERSSPGIASKLYRALLWELTMRLRKTTQQLQEAVLWGAEAASLDIEQISE
jgi:CRP-like cAMP-binding protein